LSAAIGNTKTEALAADILISNHGTIFLFRPLTDAARLHLEQHCAEATWFGGALCCEHRYAAGLAANLQGDGFTVE
jgi:hypothetical protein